MDPMEIMTEMTGFRRFRLKMKQERTLYSSLLEYDVFRKLSNLATHRSQFFTHDLHSSLALTRFTRSSIFQLFCARCT